MSERLTEDKLNSPVLEHMRKEFVQLYEDLTVSQALDSILEKQPAGRIIYFYVTDREGRLQGVVPTRRLLLSPRDMQLRELMIKPVIAIPSTATLLDACEFFVLHKLLAFPVVDEQRRILGLVDVELYAQELSDLDRQEASTDLFQLIGVYAADARPRSLFTTFRRRFPWLVATLAGGILAAVIVNAYSAVAAQAVVVAFIPLVLALSGSVTSQSVSLAVQAIRGHVPARFRLLPRIRIELATGALLGTGCGVLTGIAVYVWLGNLLAVFLLVSIIAAVACAAAIGLAMPYVLHTFNRNPQVAAGPVALATSDAITLLLYFNLARWLLG
jgi:magnesium transporter